MQIALFRDFLDWRGLVVHTEPTEQTYGADELSEYEKQRQQARIEANQDMLRQLGLAYTKNSICFSRLLLLHQELIDEVSRVVGVAAWAVRPSDAVVAHHRARLVAVALEEPPAAAADAQALELV